MSDREEANKAVVRRHLFEAISQHRADLWDEILHPDYHFHHPFVEPGRAGYVAVATKFWEACEEGEYEVLHMIAEGDLVMVHYNERSTLKAPLFGVDVAGKSYTKHGFALYRVEDGKLREAWVQEDDLGFMKQLGITNYAL